MGGSGTLPTFELLEFGGDQLLLISGRYYIPIPGIVLPFAGAPTIVVRDAIGAAGVGRLPAFEQNVSMRLELSFASAEFVLDPRTKKHKFGAGLSLSR